MYLPKKFQLYGAGFTAEYDFSIDLAIGEEVSSERFLTTFKI